MSLIKPTKEQTNNKILFVDDDVETTKLCCRFFRKRGYQADESHDIDDAIQLLIVEKYDICVADMLIQKSQIAWYSRSNLNEDGLCLVSQAKQNGLKTKFILLSGATDDNCVINGVHCMAKDSISMEKLKFQVDKLLV